MGSSKIAIKYIAKDRDRQVTFTKRKKGLIKKAMELSILCGVDVSLLIFSQQRKVIKYASKDLDKLLIEYTDCGSDVMEEYTNDDYDQKFSEEARERNRGPGGGAAGNSRGAAGNATVKEKAPARRGGGRAAAQK